jgi:uncharacterized protein
MVALAVGLTTATAACGADEPSVPSGPLRIATGGSTGVYYRYGEAIATVVRARVPQLTPTVLVTAASAQNLEMVAAGDAEIGFAQADTADAALRAGAPIAALARVYDDYLHLVVRADSDIEELDDLRGHRVSIGGSGSGTIGTVARLLDAAKLVAARPDPARPPQVTTVQLNLDESVQALRAGAIDAFFFSGGLPVAGILALKSQLPIRLVEISGEPVDELRRNHGQFYAEHSVPASTYGLAKNVTTIGIANYLVVSSARMTADTAYALTRALFEGRAGMATEHPAAARLNVREAINTYPLRLHPGATRWYRETKP